MIRAAGSACKRRVAPGSAVALLACCLVAGCGSSGAGSSGPGVSTGLAGEASARAEQTIPEDAPGNALCRSLLSIGDDEGAATAVEVAAVEQDPAAIATLRRVAKRLRAVDDPEVATETAAVASAMEHLADRPTDAARLSAAAARLERLGGRVASLC